MTVYNFNAGPAILPASVLEQVQHELRDYQGTGISVLEMSHRSSEYEAINAAAEATFKRLLGLESGYRVLFLQGGASSQFSMVPMNLLGANDTADYLLTGVWAEKALDEAAKLGKTNIAASTRAEQYCRIPDADEIHLSAAPAYVHFTSNNTIYGTQWHTYPDVGNRPLIADMSSDIMSRPLDASQFSLIYAGAQKNLGPAGATVVLIKEELLDLAPKTLPTMFRYATHAQNNSLYNTPPVFAVYMLKLVLEWIEAAGGLAAMGELNQRKAAAIYDAIDASDGFYRGHAAPDSRSLMNITFRLPDADQEKRFLNTALKAGMLGLPGHRLVGGIRVSLYNAMSLEGAQALASLMTDFASRQG